MKTVCCFILFLGGSLASAVAADRPVWPAVTREMKPWVYNWWMGSAVDAAGLEAQCRALAEKGFGGFHVIPIYGANGSNNCYRAQWKPLLSPEWIDAWNLAARTARAHDLGIDLTMGSGWCFGGPWIDKDHAASSGMKVKRAGPGGTGYMIDPFDPGAMEIHVSQFEPWFGKNGTAERPRAFYHDSYEYYGATPKDGGDVDERQLACFRVWTDWCRANGYLTRNEAHGAPSNWLDFYALADIPETEMFGRNDRDILISKFASSAAHVKGTTLVSAESCTWIDEHFHERPEEIKRFLDRLFLAGVNHVFYHGLCYSPVDAVWPGWTFYASLEMNPRNPIWREMGALNAYVTRCQSLFQTWTPDNDLALVWDPTRFRAKHSGETMNMSVHARDWFYGEPIGSVAKDVYAKGYAFDYISPRQLQAGLGARYAEVIDPEKARTPTKARAMPFTAETGLLATRWTKDGQTGYFVVNDATELRTIGAPKPFVAMNPLDGTIATVNEATIASGHSLFVIGEGIALVDAAYAGTSRTAAADTAPSAPSLGLRLPSKRSLSAETTGVATVRSPWSLTPVSGGPTLPEPRTLPELVDWRTFDEHFSGTLRYETEFTLHSPPSTSTLLNLGEVAEIAHALINGRDLGTRFMPPYVFAVPTEILKDGANELVVEVTNLGANRLRWNDLTGVNWKYFADINMVGIDFEHGNRYVKMDAAKWQPLKSGLLGPVTLESAPKGVVSGRVIRGFRQKGTSVTRDLQKRIDALSAQGGGTLRLSPGTYRSGALFFRPGVNLHLEKGATILGVDEAEEYPMRETRIEGETCLYYPALVNADGCDGFTISGEGVIDGHGANTWERFWTCRAAARKAGGDFRNKDLMRPRLLYVSHSTNVDVSGVTFKNSKFWTTHFYNCEDVVVHDCAIVADILKDSQGKELKGPSTDAVDIDKCRRFTVRNCTIAVNDDGVVVKGGKGAWANDSAKFPGNGPSTDVLVENCRFLYPTHSALTLGSECPAVKGVIFRDSTVDGVGNILNLKMRTDTPQLYEDVLVERITGTCTTFFNVQTWTQYACFQGRAKADLLSVARGVTLRDCKITCRNERKLGESENVYRLENVLLTNNQLAL